MTSSIRSTAVAAGCLLLAACGADPVGSSLALGGAGSAEFGFVLSGQSAQFNARGVRPLAGSMAGSWAGGLSAPQTGGKLYYSIMAASPRAGRQDLIQLEIPGSAGGQAFDLAAPCGEGVCHHVAVVLNYTRENQDSGVRCNLTEGRLQIGSAAGTRVMGTFSGRGSCVAPQGPVGTIIVTEGTFDVPVLATHP